MSSDAILSITMPPLPKAHIAGQSSTPSAGSSDMLQDFNTLLSLMMGQIMSSSGSASAAGSSIASMLGGNMGALSQSLSESLFSQQIQNAYQSGSSVGTALSSSVSTAFHHINQFTADVQEGGDGRNADCGPTSLVMALHQLGISVAGETSGISDGKAVDLARFSMASSRAKDGIDASGRRSDAEHSTYTNFSDLARGASAAGAKNELIRPSAAGIASALQSGASVIASGTFTGKSPLPWTGDRGSDNAGAPGHAGAHFVEVTAYDASTGLFTVNDPARNHALQVSGSALENFMAGNAGAIALYK